VLHEGPVLLTDTLEDLTATRVDYLGASGAGDRDTIEFELTSRDRGLAVSAQFDRVVLWFEHDLYDQLQLLQLLDWLAAHPPRKLALVCHAEYLGECTPERLLDRYQARRPLTATQMSLAQNAWAAFRDGDPTAIERVLAGNTDGLRFLRAAFERHLQQFPSVVNGLSRSEAQALDALADAPAAPRAVYYHSHHRREDAVFLGDASFAICLRALSTCTQPLVLAVDGGVLGRDADAGFWNTAVALTSFGRSVAAGEADHVRSNGIDRWLGGVHLHGRETPWRWSPDERRLIRSGPDLLH
jgi:hypothetical protein